MKLRINKEACLRKVKDYVAIAKQVKQSKRARIIFNNIFNPATFVTCIGIAAIIFVLNLDDTKAVQTEAATINSISKPARQVEKRDYRADAMHYRKVVASACAVLSKDSLSQANVLTAIGDISYQSLFAGRLPKPITPYNMVNGCISDQVLRDKILLLVNNDMFFRQEGTSFQIDDLGQFTFNDDQWYHVRSEAEISKIDYSQIICMVMGIDYVAPKPRDPSTKVEVAVVVKSSGHGPPTVN